MSKIYTKGGDKGQTGLFSGERVDKDHPLVNAYGTVDELNSVLGMARAALADFSSEYEGLLRGHEIATEHASALSRPVVDNPLVGRVRARFDEQRLLDSRLHTIQLQLFELGAQMAFGKLGQERISDEHVAVFEQWIDELTAGLPELKNFILPTGHPAAAHLHLARTICRRAERAVISARDPERFDDVVIRYLNRLADLLFVLAREANRIFGVEDEPWRASQPPG